MDAGPLLLAWRRLPAQVALEEGSRMSAKEKVEVVLIGLVLFNVLLLVARFA